MMPKASQRKGAASVQNGDPDQPALEFKGVSKFFVQGRRRIPALQDVSVRIARGRITGLIGPDGAGKTSLMRLSACLLKPAAGAVTVLDIDALAEPLKVQASIGYMPQRFGLYEDLSVQENLDLYADLQGVVGTERPGRYAELTRLTNLGAFTTRLAGQLSGGMKQKLGLACTLVRPPRLLLLDEPTVGVDPVSRRELWNIVGRLVETEKMSVFLSTAYLDEAERCDEVVILHEGRVLGQGAPADFRARQKGRTYTVKTDSLKKRELQERLADAEGVVDAVIQGDAVRMVMGDEKAPEFERLLPHVPRVDIVAVPPRFEDQYVAMLKARRGDDATGSKPSAEMDVSVSPAAANEAVIRVDHVRRRFGDFYAVKNVSFEVFQGEVFGLLGANGAGKTTTFRMLCGLLPVSEGQLSVAGRNLRRAAAQARARIGYMSQKFSLYGNLSVRQNLLFFSSAYGLSGQRRRDRIDWVLNRFDLSELADAVSGDLSLGFKQRLALAAALMHAPDILFLDEPTSGVDPMARREFWRHINSLAASGVTVLVTTHFMEEAEYCDRLAIMAAGEILAIGSPIDIKQKAADRNGRSVQTMEEAFIALIERQAPPESGS
ncbi:MAG: ATP-binding cassette domain-containing protein [Desulfobacterales bacterium]